MTGIPSTLRSARRLSGLALAGAIVAAAASPASAAVCDAFTLTSAQVAVFENGTWSHTSFQQNGADQFTVMANQAWPSTVSLILRWDINPSADPSILPAASLAPLPVYLDYQYVADGFGTSFGAVAQVNNVVMNTGSRPVYFEMAVTMPQIGCDLIRSAPATLVVTPSLEVDPDRIPELVCQGPGCDLLIRRPGDIVINPGLIQQIRPGQQIEPGAGRVDEEQIQPGQIQRGQLPGQIQLQQLPQLQLRN